MPVVPAAARRGVLAGLYQSDLAYWAGLMLIWKLLVILIALWVVPVVLCSRVGCRSLARGRRRRRRWRLGQRYGQSGRDLGWTAATVETT